MARTCFPCPLAAVTWELGEGSSSLLQAIILSGEPMASQLLSALANPVSLGRPPSSPQLLSEAILSGKGERVSQVPAVTDLAHELDITLETR